ncbi:ISSod13, transposase [Wolbachia endosymbiont of Armadillidium vulgare str. wVulC]|nr:ISSod13, transposase [Wolbachia endosymbiont of Armadillidium vulgare str. wVulC]
MDEFINKLSLTPTLEWPSLSFIRRKLPSQLQIFSMIELYHFLMNRLLRILTDRGTEYCGKPGNHAYQLYLGIENIDHSRTNSTD